MTYVLVPAQWHRHPKPSDRMTQYKSLLCQALRQDPALSRLSPRVMVSQDPQIPGFPQPPILRATVTLKGYYPIDLVEFDQMVAQGIEGKANQFVSSLSKAFSRGLVRKEGERFRAI